MYCLIEFLWVPMNIKHEHPSSSKNKLEQISEHIRAI